MSKNICIYHKNCLDGFGAALAVHQHFVTLKNEPIDLIPAHYGDDPPAIDDRTNVIIVDFSYPRKTLERIYETARSLHVIDHHKSAQKDLEGLDFCTFDLSKSGALLAWEHYMSHAPVPPLVNYICDRDLWHFALNHTKAVTAALMTLPFDVQAWLLYLYNVSPLITKGQAITEYQNRIIKKLVESDNIPMHTISGHNVPCINTPHLISEIGVALADNHPFVAMYFDTENERVYSLRSAEDGLDVSEIARKYGGGGHKHAAGFKTAKPSHLIE